MEHLLRVEAMKTGGTIRRPEGDDKENEPSKRLRRSRRQQQKEDAKAKTAADEGETAATKAAAATASKKKRANEGDAGDSGGGRGGEAVGGTGGGGGGGDDGSSSGGGMAPTTKKAKARHSGRNKRSGLRPGDGRRNSTEGSAGAVGGDEKKARRAKTKDGEPSTKPSSKARSSSAPSSLRRGCIIIANQCSIKVTYLCMNAHPVSVVFR